MAYNVFGNSITNSTLEAMPDYVGKTITRKDRAHVALNMKNAENKDVNARTFVEKLKEIYGNGVSTLCLVYNATGDPLTFVESINWSGHIGSSPYPQWIANGQWGAYLHVKTSGAARGSVGAAVYKGLNDAGEDHDWMFAWSSPWDQNTAKQVCTKVRESGHFAGDTWNEMYYILVASGINESDLWNGSVSMVGIGESSSPYFEAILTLEGA